MCYGTVTTHIIEVTVIEKELHQRCCNLVFTGLPYSKMQINFARDVTNVKEQRAGGISKRHGLPFQSIMEIEIFDCCRINFVGPLSMFYSNEYMLVALEYVLK